MNQEDELLGRYLDGDIPLDQLSEAQRAEARAFERLWSTGGRERLPRSIRPAVMARVREAAQPAWRRALRWTTTPRPLRVRPLTAGLALAAGIVLVVLARPADVPSPSRPAGSVATRFVLLAPEAQQVAVTGDFVAWDPQGVALRRVQPGGAWIAEIDLPPGVHHYVFVIDGRDWHPDPSAPSQVDDGFGQKNSVLVVPTPRVS